MKDIKILGYIPLFYGAEYIEACIKSMLPFVDKLIIVYVDKASQGHKTNIPCPESRELLHGIAVKAVTDMGANGKFEWHDAGTFPDESSHRNYILQFSEGYDLIFTLDADEVCEPLDMTKAIEAAYNSDKRHIGISGFINFWRSFSWACYDSFIPYRFVNLRNLKGTDQTNLRIYHFSTAQDIKTIKFKWNVSGHKNELRPDWFEIHEKWKPWINWMDNRGLHPVALDLWLATPFDKETLPEVLKEHLNFNKELI